MPDNTQKITDFLQDIIKVYEKHGMAISHEDFGGAFTVVKLDEFHVNWLLHAIDELD